MCHEAIYNPFKWYLVKFGSRKLRVVTHEIIHTRVMVTRKGLFFSRRDSCERELSVSQNVKINFYSKIFSKSQNYAPTRSAFAIQSLTAVYQKKLFLYNVLRLPEITAWKCLLRKYLNLLTKRFLNTKTYIIPEYLHTELQNYNRGMPLSLRPAGLKWNVKTIWRYLGLVQTSIFTCTEPNVSIKYM